MLELMEILVTGLHGFIGQVLKETFEKNGHHVFTASREALLTGNEELKDAARRADIVVNLAGESIAGRWTDEKMIEIVESRRCITRNLVRCIQGSEKKPLLWINASAVGVYKPDTFCDEYSADLGHHFLAGVIKVWEGEVAQLEQVRKVILRFGIVIGQNGGVLHKLKPMIKSRVAVIMGNGKQEFPLIHVEDVAGFVMYVLDHRDMEGVYNLVIPNAVTYREFVRSLAVIRKPLFTVVLPEWLLWLLMGESAYTLTRSARVIPMRMMTSGYELKYRTVREIVH